MTKYREFTQALQNISLPKDVKLMLIDAISFSGNEELSNDLMQMVIEAEEAANQDMEQFVADLKSIIDRYNEEVGKIDEDALAELDDINKEIDELEDIAKLQDQLN